MKPLPITSQAMHATSRTNYVLTLEASRVFNAVEIADDHSTTQASGLIVAKQLVERVENFSVASDSAIDRHFSLMMIIS